MKMPKQRKTTAIGVNRGHSKYKNWKDSVKDYKFWQDKYYKSGDYYQFLIDSGYCPYNNSYIKTLKQIKL